MPDIPPRNSGDPVPMLSYHSPVSHVVEPGVAFRRHEATLIITMAPPPFGRQLAVRLLFFLFCALPIAGLLAMVVVMPTNETRGLGIIGALLAIPTWFMLKQLIHWIRTGRLPSFIRAGPEGLEVHAQGRSRAVSFDVLRNRIADIHVHSSATAIGSQLYLQVILDDETTREAIFPWRDGQPMIEVEDNLRDALGLPPTPR